MKHRMVAAIATLVVAAGLLVFAAAAQDATPEVTPEPEIELTASPRPYLGVRIAMNADPDQAGVLVVAVDAESPAAAAGLEIGDVITAVNGSAVAQPQDVADVIAGLAVGDTVVVDVVRAGEALSVEAELAVYPDDAVTLRFGPGPGMRGDGQGNRGDRGGMMPIDPEQLPDMFRFFMQPDMGMFGQNGRLGVAFITLDEQAAAENDVELTEGALITDVAADSPAAEAGLAVGDIVTAVNDEPVNQEITLRDRLFAYEPEDIVTLTVVRAGETIAVEVTLGQPMQSAMEMMPFGGQMPFGFGQGDGNRGGGLGGLLPPGHPPVPISPSNPGDT